MLRQRLTLLTIAALALMSGVQLAVGLPWLQVNMYPENADGAIELGVLSGGELIPALSAITPVMWLGVLVALLLRNRVWIGYLFLTALGVVCTFLVAGYSLSGDTDSAKDQLSSWQNVAAAHDVTNLDIVRLANEWLGLVAALLVTVGFAILSVYSFRLRRIGRERNSLKTEGKRGAASAVTDQINEGDDPISLWDAQRPRN